MDLFLPSPGFYAKAKSLLFEAKGDKSVADAIVNTPFESPAKVTALGLGVTVLLMTNEETQTIDRVALSDTDSAKGAMRMSVKPFNTIKIPIDHAENIIAKTLLTGEPHKTADWNDMFVPALSAEQARFNQAGAGIGCSVVYPVNDKTAMIFSYYLPPEKVNHRHYTFMQKYTELVATRLSQK